MEASLRTLRRPGGSMFRGELEGSATRGAGQVENPLDIVLAFRVPKGSAGHLWDSWAFSAVLEGLRVWTALVVCN